MSADRPIPAATDERLFTWISVAGGLIVLAATLWLGDRVLKSLVPSGPAADEFTPLPLPRPLLDFALTERSGRAVSRAEFTNQFLVVNFAYTSCETVCRQVSRQMAKIQRQLEDRPDVRLLSITIDPRTDTPEVLQEFAAEFTTEPERWLFLTGDKAAVYGLLEHSFLPRSTELDQLQLTPGGFTGTDQILLVDPTGEVCATFPGLAGDVVTRLMAELDRRSQERTFEARGVVRSIPAEAHTLVVRHEEIPNYMPRMTMELNVKNPSEMAGLAVGDEITFQLVATQETHWIEGIQRVGAQSVVVDTAAVEEASLIQDLSPGDALPDFELLTEDGDTRRLSSFRGSAVALTFIFTRCPLPDFCPLMNRNFARAYKLLAADDRTANPGNWQMLTVSFDPEFDRPEVLARYAQGYRGTAADHWLFASVQKEALQTLAPQLDLQVSREGGSFSHNLRTVVFDPRGRIHRQFDGNRWTAGQLAESLRQAAAIR